MKEMIGIFGGSFDPIHEAHISLAKDALDLCNLDKVIFVPARLQPFKLNKKVTPAEDRLTMVQLATYHEDKFEVSDFEINSQEVSYSYLTMRYMQKMHPDARLCFITGTDAFLMIEKWANAEEMLTNYSYIIGTRPGYKEEELAQVMARVKDNFGTDVVNIRNKQIDVSSTEIRDKLADGESVDGLIPEAVIEYIENKGLYR
ncbi:MAG: nicotinate-nucleotide adenylyltransferase [Eubacterium sp.]|nr:nicotinate-nucleotide adenylyltransferase [Candidatus Colimonas fimequi]